MEERLKQLKKSMQNTTFSQLAFTDKLRKEIREEIAKQSEKDEDILLAVMQLLVHEKTGFELAKNLRGRGIKRFEDQEGFLYSMLHRLELKGYLQTGWNEAEAKVYCLNNKGRKLLSKAEKKQKKNQFVFKELLEG